MPRSYPGSELTIEQLVHALVQALDPNSPSKGKSLELEPPKIFDIERDLCAILQATRTIRNTFMPINGFPPEILSRVFEHRDRDRDLIAATHVCWYWRSTLVSSPLLWTNFRFESTPDLDRTFTYLERSKSTSLDIKISSHTLEDLEILKHLAPHIARTGSFVIDGTCLDVHAISHLFRNPVPSLQHLQIDSRECPIRLPDDFITQASSLRFAGFSGICPTSRLPFPLPNLIQFALYLLQDRVPLRMSALFRFFSGSPRLQKVYIHCREVLKDIAPDQVISLESLAEFSCMCKPASRILHCLRLPHLERLSVHFTMRSGQVSKLADLLPFDGHLLLTAATKMLYSSDGRSHSIHLSGKGIDISLSVFTEDPTPVDWFSDETHIPFEQIEDLTIQGRHNSSTANFPIHAFENLGVLRIIPWDVEIVEGFSLLLSPRAGTSCLSLREIRYTYQEPLDALISLARERKLAGHQLELVWLFTVSGFDEDRTEELREHVGEVLRERWDTVR